MKSHLVRAFIRTRKTKPIRRRPPAALRRLSCELLEDRRLLAVSPGHDSHEHEFPGTIPPGAVEIANGGFDVRPHVGKAITAAAGVDFTTPPSTQSPGAAALNFLKTHAALFDAKASDFEGAVVSSQSTSTVSGVTHVYLQQRHNGIDVFGGVANVSLNPQGQVLYAASSFVSNVAGTLNATAPTQTAEQAIAAAAQNLGVTLSESLTAQRRDNDADRSAVFSDGGISHDPIPVKLEILPMSATQSRLVWNLVINLDTTPDVFEVNVDAVNGQVLGRLNWTNYDSYRVFPLPLESPQDGPGLPASHQIVQNPADPAVSPFGWHDSNGSPGPEFTDTRGNNVDALEDRDGDLVGPRPSGGPNNDYDFPFNPAQGAAANTNEAVVNLFYWNNIVHDVMALNGFDEAAGNFQTTNYSGAGLGQDHVIALAQFGANLNIFNNAAFATFPEGTSSFMLMFEFTLTTPSRDSDNAAEIIVHEYFHGVTNRLVAGPSNVSALAGIQSGGMGEGWSDFYSLVFTAKPTDRSTDSYPVGNYVLGQPQNGPGVRRFPYSTNKAVDPLTYNDIDIVQSEVCTFLCDEVHNVGEIWASALWDLYWLLAERDGFDPDLYTGTGGNNLAMRLVTEGLKFTPANPTMLQARDAILAADQAVTGGANFFEIWTAFAGRGMGFSADDGGDHNSVSVSEAFDLPPTLVSGIKFNDLNNNGLRDAGEPGLEGWTIYADLDQNGVRDPGEPSAVTNANGGYQLSLLPAVQQLGFGDFDIREERQLGWQQTFPRANLPSDASPASLVVVRDGFYTVTIPTRETLIGGVNFGNFGAPGEIRGVKFFDENGNGVRDAGEVGQSGVTIQLFDEDNNLLETTVTGADGSYRFENVLAERYIVREVVPPSQTQTFPPPAPAAEDGAHVIDLQPTQVRLDVHFGNFGRRGSISGRKFDDINGNGVFDPEETGVAGAVIYIDMNRDGIFTLDEPAQTTDAFGLYRFDRVVPGTYLVREVIPDGTSQTTPGGGGELTVVVIAGRETANQNFGNREFRDFGDAPAPYPTTRAQGGASHGIRNGFFLGSGVDAESDGRPDPLALGDDTPGSRFAAAVNYAVGDAPVAALAADLDRERGLDVVVVNQAGNSISVLLNNSDGTFADAVHYAVGTQPSRVAAGDFDRDGDLDLAVTNTGSNNVSLLRGRGDGTFAPAVNIGAGLRPRGVAVGDLDGDGFPDLAVSNFDATAQSVTVLLNERNAGSTAADPLEFASPLRVAVNEGPVADVAIGDINRDGRLDLVAANSQSDSVSLLLNLGVVDDEPTFSQAFDFVVGNEPLQVILADVNRDGALDAATANAQDGTVSVLVNRGAGTFFPKRDSDVGGAPQSVASADIDGDGDLDLAAATRDAARIPILLNNGAAVFTRGNDLSGGAQAAFVVAADFNGDGGADVVAVNEPTDSVSFVGSAGDDEDGVQFSPQSLTPGANGAVDVTASDAGFLSAWIDWNRDGDWNDAGEKFISDRALSAGLNRIFFAIPANASVGATFARFRFSDRQGLGPTGAAGAGEVEDYRVGVGIGGETPASPDTNPQNPLDVNADGAVTINDVLVLINELRNHGVRQLPPRGLGQDSPPFFDPSGDGFITLNDVLRVLNALMTQTAEQANGEGESAADRAAASSFVFLPAPRADRGGDSPAEDAASTTAAEPSIWDSRSAAGAVHTVRRYDAPAPIDALLGDEEDEQDHDDEWEGALEAIAGDVSRAWGEPKER